MNNKQQTIVFKVSDNMKQNIIDFYSDRFSEKKPPYSVFQVKDYDCTITLYESGKIMFQGLGADIEASYWTEMERVNNKRDVNSEIEKDKKKKEDKKEELKDDRFRKLSTIGSDEVGTGDYFGPIVVTASYVDISKKAWLSNLGVKDSKMVTDEKIMSIAPMLIKDIPHVTFILTPKEYNKAKIFNMNKVKAILHNKVLYQLKQTTPKYDAIVVDQFVYPTKYYEHIKEVPGKVTDITFTTHAENKCLSVAVSSIISRYIFIKEMDKLADSLHLPLPKGAGDAVDSIGKELVNKYGFDKLYDVAKINFKNTDKIKDL